MSKSNLSSVSRRTAFAGVGVMGALGALVATSGLRQATQMPPPSAAVQPEPTGGYQLTAHVQQYYASARL